MIINLCSSNIITWVRIDGARFRFRLHAFANGWFKCWYSDDNESWNPTLHGELNAGEEYYSDTMLASKFFVICGENVGLKFFEKLVPIVSRHSR